jgi:hypothetical protein
VQAATFGGGRTGYVFANDSNNDARVRATIDDFVAKALGRG